MEQKTLAKWFKSIMILRCVTHCSSSPNQSSSTSKHWWIWNPSATSTSLPIVGHYYWDQKRRRNNLRNKGLCRTYRMSWEARFTSCLKKSVMFFTNTDKALILRMDSKTAPAATIANPKFSHYQTNWVILSRTRRWLAKQTTSCSIAPASIQKQTILTLNNSNTWRPRLIIKGSS